MNNEQLLWEGGNSLTISLFLFFLEMDTKNEYDREPIYGTLTKENSFE